jgi:hypothetical protein
MKSGARMNYLCDGHRDEFVNNPQQAVQAWKEIILQARESYHLQDWERSTLVYGNAFEISELLLSSYPTQFSVDRYLRTALEFAYSLRKGREDADLDAFVVHVKGNVETIKHTMAISMLMQPLEEVIKLPIDVADFWMKSLLSLDYIEARVLH